MKYLIKANIVPHQSKLTVSCCITDLPQQDGLTFYLNKNFEIGRIGCDGESWNYQFDMEGKAPQFVPIARPLQMDVQGNVIEFEYDGVIDALISDVNIISPDLVELV